MYSLAQYDVEEIVKNLPIICEDIDRLWHLLLQVYGDDCFTPNIVRKFPAQFTGDTKSQRDALTKLQESFNVQIAQFEAKVTNDIKQKNAELESSMSNSSTLERLYHSVHTKNLELKI